MNDVTFAKNLASVMLDNKYDRFVKNRRTGKLDMKSLYKVSTSTKLFKRREARKNKDYAIALVVDLSGSMSGEKLSVAADSAVRLSKHLAGMSIPHSVIGFGTFAQDIKPFGPKFDPKLGVKINSVYQGGDGSVYAIHDGNNVVNRIGKSSYRSLVRTFVLKNGVSIYAEQQRAEAEMRRQNPLVQPNLILNRSSGATALGEVVMFARERLLKEKGKRIMIVLTDGNPEPLTWMESPNKKGYGIGDFELKAEVNHTIRAGVEIYGVGIMSDVGNKYFPKSRACAINSLDQLYPHIIKLIKRNLRRG